MSHVASYYAASANPHPSYPRLEEDVDADVCVIGGGIAGCSTALNLAERGYRVVLLEAQRIGWGASGRSGGQAIVGYASGQQKLIDALGIDGARKLWNVTVDAMALLRERIARHKIECDLHSGQLQVAIKARHEEALRREQRELEETFNYPHLRFVERGALQSLLATDRYIAGLYDAGSAHLHPLNYTLGLADAARTAGVRIFENSPATKIDRESPAVVQCASGKVTARYVAVCCNAYIDGLIPEIQGRIMPVGTYIVATEPLGRERMTELIRENIAVTDVNFVLDYFRRSADDRLLFGGRVSYSGLDAFDTRSATRKRMLNVFPQLADAKIAYAWGGYVDITMSR
ncbi:MAG: NAD(P)/FAD-dependent oxidoreductase, partial [Povalibacter sp.]